MNFRRKRALCGGSAEESRRPIQSIVASQAALGEEDKIQSAREIVIIVFFVKAVAAVGRPAALSVCRRRKQALRGALIEEL